MKILLHILFSLAIFSAVFAFHINYDIYSSPVPSAFRAYRTPEKISTTQPTPSPPMHGQVAAMARYIIHYSDWATLSHISYAENTTMYPQARVFAMSDGPLVKGGSTGIPYFYTTLMEPGTDDLINENPRSSVTASLAQGSYCKNNLLDVEDPRCAQVILTGNFTKIEKNSKEWSVARKALFSRHPQMENFPKTHDFFFAKLIIHEVQVVDYFGGSEYPSIGDYFRSDPPYEVPRSHSPAFYYKVTSVL